MSEENCQEWTLYRIRIGSLVYVGCAKNLTKRWFNHLSRARSNDKKSNYPLYVAIRSPFESFPVLTQLTASSFETPNIGVLKELNTLLIEAL